MIIYTLLAVALTIPNEAVLVTRLTNLVTDNGQIVDRASDHNTISVAATGLGNLALAVAADRGWCDREFAVRNITQGFEFTVNSNSPNNRGWLPHFTDVEGHPKPHTEISTIDTALFYAGMLQAAEVLKLTDLKKRIESELAKIDTDFVMVNGYFSHGFYWDPNTGKADLIKFTWSDTSEGVILYRLFNKPFEPKVSRVDYPLFVYCYPLLFFNEDNYFKLLDQAIEYQTKTYGYAGVTATDGPNGYVVDDSEVISPLLLASISERYPHVTETLEKLDVDPNISAYHVPSQWKTDDELTIDLASAYILFVRLGK